MKINQLKAGALLSYLQLAITVLVGLLYTPIMIRLLGQSEYGLYNTVSSTIAMLGILSLGLNSGYIRYYSRYKSSGDEQSVSVLNGTFMFVFCIIGAIALVAGGVLTYNLDLVFKSGLTVEEYEIAEVLMLISTLNMAISFPMSVFGNIISAHERFVFLKVLGMIKILAGPMVTLPLLLLGYRSIAMVTVSFCISLIIDSVYMIYALFVLKCKFIFKRSNIFKELFKYTSAIALISIVDTINWQMDKIILGRYCGTVMVAIYSVGYSLQTYYMMFSTAFIGIFTPKIHRIVNENTNAEKLKYELTDLFTKVGRLQYLLLALVASGFIFFGKSFIGHWVGGEYGDSYIVAIMLMLSATIPYMQNLGIEIQRSQNKHYFRGVLYLSVAIVNLVSSIFLSQKYGAIGCALATAVSFVIGNVIIMNIYYHKRCNIDIIHFWKNILSIMKGQILPAAVGVLIMRFADMSNIFMMFVWIFVYTCVYCLSVWFLSMNKYEKELVLAPVRRIPGLLLKRKNEKS